MRSEFYNECTRLVKKSPDESQLGGAHQSSYLRRQPVPVLLKETIHLVAHKARIVNHSKLSLARRTRRYQEVGLEVCCNLRYHEYEDSNDMYSLYCNILVIADVLYFLRNNNLLVGVTQESAICGSREVGLLVEQRENA